MPEAALAKPSPRISAKGSDLVSTSKTGGNGTFGSGAGLPLFLQGASGAGTLVQTKLIVNKPGDAFEQEADAVAKHAANGTSSASPPAAASPPDGTIQRKCAACASGQPCSDCESKQGLGASAGTGTLAPPDSGSPLSAPVRERVEPALGADLGDVRVHSSPSANEAASQLNAKAFTHGTHIWLGPNQSPDDIQLVAHEATHVVQQNAAPRLLSAAAPQISETASSSNDAKFVQRDAEPGVWDRVVNAGQKLAGDALDVGKGVVRAVGETARDTALATLRLVSPELADMAEQGPGEFIKGLVNKALHQWLPALLGGFDPVNAAQEFMDGLGETFQSLAGLLKGEAKSCDGFAKILDGIRNFGHDIMESTVVQTLQKAMTEANAALSKAMNVVAAPVFDAIVGQLGATWKVVSGAAKTVWGWIKSAKAAVGDAWDWVARKLGLVGAEGEEGILDWVKRKAGEVWEEIKATFAPAIGPLKKVVIGLGMFTGLGQVYLLVKYGPKLVDAVTWLWEHRNDPDIIRSAREQMKDTILPQLLEAVSGFKSVIAGAATWLTTTLTGLAADLLGAVQGVTGVPLFSLAQDALQAAANAVKDLLGWVEKQVNKASEWFGSIISKVSAFLAPYQEILTSIGLALVNPPMIPIILAGWAWEILPRCIKGPVIDFLLDIIIGAIEALPDLPMFGPLWSILRPSVLSFLQKVRSQPMDTKVAISNKIAKIIRGSSLGFLTGFAKGVLVGVWEGIRDPVQGIWMVMKGLTWVMDYLDSLTNAATTGDSAGAQPLPSGDSGVVTLRSTAATPISEAGSQPAPAPASASGLSPQQMQDLASEAGGFAGAVQPDVDQVISNFWSAAEEYFSGGSGVTFDELSTKLGDAWTALQSKMSELGGEMAQKVVAFFSSDAEADSKLGEGVGWLVGNIGFQLLLDYISAGTWEGIGRVLQMIAKFLNWPMEVMGAAFKLLKKLGGMLLDGLKSLGKMALEAGSGALSTVSKALGGLSEKLMSFAERLLGKFGGAAARGGEHVAGAEAARLAEGGLTHAAESQGLRTGEKEAMAATERDAANALEKKTAAEAEGKTLNQAERDAAEKAAELPEVIAEAQAIETGMAVTGAPVEAVIATLDVLKTKYKWIKRFEKETTPVGSFIYLIASRVPIGPYYSTLKRRPPPGRSERDVGDHLGSGWQEQPEFLYGGELSPSKSGGPRRIRDSTRPEFYNPDLRVAVEVKNWDLTNYDGMIQNILDQQGGRTMSLPRNAAGLLPDQWLFMDLRGQRVGDLANLAERVRRDTRVFSEIHFILDSGPVRVL
jgi:hypothetical protein